MFSLTYEFKLPRIIYEIIKQSSLLNNVYDECYYWQKKLKSHITPYKIGAIHYLE